LNQESKKKIINCGVILFKIDRSDVKELAKANVTFDDSDLAKEFVLNNYLETLDKLRKAGVVNADKTGNDILKLQVGWSEVLKDFGFWSKISV
jgi:predicted house-cleaning NTP pyrophosphatase (Maf/HAM1 superfamily)